MFESLPNETFIEIFKNLNHNELLRVSEVSKRFYENATHSSLWKNFDISSKSHDVQIRLLKLSRFQSLKTLKLSADLNGRLNNDILEKLMNVELEELNLDSLNFESIDKVLLAKVISKTKVVRLCGSENLEQDKIKEIMEKIPCGCIQDLFLCQVDFLGVDSKTISRAINSLQKFHEKRCRFEERQITETLEEMSKETNVKSLVITSRLDFIKNVPARILSKALNNLEDLTLYDKNVVNSFTSEQMVEFFYEMSHQTNLLKVVLIFLDDDSRGLINSVPADILASAICKLKIFIAPQLRFSESQIKSISKGRKCTM